MQHGKTGVTHSSRRIGGTVARLARDARPVILLGVTDDQRHAEQRLFQTVRGYYETKALLALWRLGLLERAGLGEELMPADLVASGDYDEEALTALLDYLTVRGYLLLTDGTYTLTDRGAGLLPYAGYLAALVGAYEPVMAEVEHLVRGRKVFGRDVRRSVIDLASGLTALENNLLDSFGGLLRDRRFTRVMDLGCGSGRMLSRIVRSRPGTTGVGVDVDAEICSVAEAMVAGEGFADRISVVTGDAGSVLSVPPEVRAGVDLVTVMFMLHELLRQRGRDGVSRCLAEIAELLGPRGTLLVVEVETVGPPVARDGLLFTPEYEFAHVLTHQRLTTKKEWTELADAAGFRVERIEPLRMCWSFCMVLVPKIVEETP